MHSLYNLSETAICIAVCTVYLKQLCAVRSLWILSGPTMCSVQSTQFIWTNYVQFTVNTISPSWATEHSRPAHFCRRHNLKNSQINLGVRTGVVKIYDDDSVVVRNIRVAMLDQQPSSQPLHFQTAPRSLRIKILRALPANKMRRVDHSLSHVPVRDASNLCRGETDERAAWISPKNLLALNK